MQKYKTLDVSGELNNYVFKGVQHKYPETLLIITTPSCFKYCDFCLRKRFTKNKSTDEVFDLNDIDKLVNYINDNNIMNILLSGGDFLYLNNTDIKIYLNKLFESKIKYIRIASKTMVHNLERFDDELFAILSKYSDKLVFQTHFDTADEITTDVKVVAQKIYNMGIQLYNQTVMLDKVNNNHDEIYNICIKLFDSNIIPYYFYHCRPIEGNKKYETNIFENTKILKNVRENLPGNLKQFKYILTNELGKIEVVGSNENNTFIKYNQCVNRNIIDVPFIIDKKHTWITIEDIDKYLKDII